MALDWPCWSFTSFFSFSLHFSHWLIMNHYMCFPWIFGLNQHVCVCVCVSEREREHVVIRYKLHKITLKYWRWDKSYKSHSITFLDMLYHHFSLSNISIYTQHTYHTHADTYPQVNWYLGLGANNINGYELLISVKHFVKWC